MDYKDISEEHLRKAFHEAAMELSYRNAAEGQSWYAESRARSVCRGIYTEICSELKERGLERPSGNYLI